MQFPKEEVAPEVSDVWIDQNGLKAAVACRHCGATSALVLTPDDDFECREKVACERYARKRLLIDLELEHLRELVDEIRRRSDR